VVLAVVGDCRPLHLVACCGSVIGPLCARIPRRPLAHTRERVGEGRFERVVCERVQERVNGAVGVTEDREELEQVDLVGGKRERIGYDEDDVDLERQAHDTQHVIRLRVEVVS